MTLQGLYIYGNNLVNIFSVCMKKSWTGAGLNQ